jgi:hypothetical protein
MSWWFIILGIAALAAVFFGLAIAAILIMTTMQKKGEKGLGSGSDDASALS